MAYVSTADLQNRLGSTLYARLTDRVGGNAANTTVAQQLVDEAEAVANSLLAPRYATPIDLSARPELALILRSRVLDLAEYMAWKSSPFTNDPPSRVSELHREAWNWFESVAAGRILLPAVAPPAGRSATREAPQYATAPRTLTHEELDGL